MHYGTLKAGIHRTLTLAVLAGAVLAALYLSVKALNTQDGLDFRLIWLSGQLWMSGVSPYSSDFSEAYLAAFGEGPNTHFWVYPPYWIALSAPLSMLPFRSALMVWNLLNLGLLGLTAWLTAERISAVVAQRRIAFLTIFIFGGLLQATPFALALGQSAFLVAAGAAVFIKGYVERKQVWLAAGVLLLMLKPHLGLVALCLLAMRPSAWRAAAGAAIVCAGFTALAIFSAGFEETIGGFLNALSNYRDVRFSATQPENLTGFVHLWSLVSGWSPPTGAMVLLAGGVSAATAVLVKDPHDRCLIMVGAMIALVPMHTYDFGLVLVMLPLLARRTSWQLLAAVVGCLLLFRCGNLATSLGLTNPESSQHFPGSLLASLAAMLLLFAAVNIYAPRRQAMASG